jgi:hypothetical protein
MNNISQLRRTASSFRGRAAGALAALSLIASLGGATTASADMNVAGVWFEPTAICTAQTNGSPGSLEMKVSSNSAQGVYYMTFVSDYSNGKWGSWVSGNVWHDASAWGGLNSTEDFHFYRYAHNYHRVLVHYAVKTSAGWVYGWENLQHYIEFNNVAHTMFPTAENTTYCWI